MQSKLSRTALRLLVGILLALAVSSVSAQSGGEFRVGTNAPVDLNPSTGTNDPEILFNRMIYDYLIDVSPAGDLVPNLATEWEISEDGLSYRLTLREGVTFHDGSALTSEDVVASFNRLLEGSPALSLLGDDFSIAADGDNAVVFTLTGPNADFLFGVASRWSFILSADIIAEGSPNVLGEGDDLYGNFVGTGPFILTDFQPGESATFTANENYWIPGQPALDSVTHIYIEDQQAQIDALRSGTVDFIFKVSFDRVEELEAAGLNVLIEATNQHPVIRIRADEGALGEDVRVRQAFKLATDRDILNLNLFDGRAAVGNNDPIGPLYGPFYSYNDMTQDPDAEQACALLAEAGYPDGLGADTPIDFYVANAFNYVQMAEFLQQQWAEACINVNILVRSEGEYYAGDADTAEWLNVDLGVTGWGSRPIPQQYLVEAYVTSALPENGGFNESRWSDAELDALVAEAGVTADIEARAAIYADIAGIFAERGPIIIPFFAPIVGVVADGVEGLEMNPFPGSTDFRTVTVSN